jgi:hypothetical protein
MLENEFKKVIKAKHTNSTMQSEKELDQSG